MQRFARILFWSALVFALVMASMQQPVAIPGNPGDKLQHIAAFVILTVLGSWAYPRVPVLTIFVGLALFGGLIEIVQAIPALKRDSDVFDWIADCGAVMVTLGVIALFRTLGKREGSA